MNHLKKKTKRKTLEVLLSDQWSYQLSIFYRCFSNRLFALEHKEKVTRVLKRLNPEQPMLYRLCLYNAPHEHLDDIDDNDLLTERMPYHAIFSSDPFSLKESELAEALSQAVGVSLNVLKRGFKGELKRIRTSDLCLRRKRFFEKIYLNQLLNLLNK